MQWALLLMCFILGAFASFRPSGRKKDFRKPKTDH